MNNQDTPKEVLRLIKEQTAQSRPPPEMSPRCQNRSDRIRKLLKEISQHGDSKQPEGQPYQTMHVSIGTNYSKWGREIRVICRNQERK